MSSPLILKHVGLDLFDQPNASAFLTHVDQRAATGLINQFQGFVQLLPAVAAQRMEDIPRKALGVNAHKRRC